MKYKIINTGEQINQRGRPAYRLIAKLVERNKCAPRPTKVKNHLIAQHVQAMYEVWAERRTTV